MRRARTSMAAIVVAAVLATGAVAAAASLGSKSANGARVTLAACHPSAQPARRYAAFSGQMHALPATSWMAMRFTLLERVGRVGPFRPVPLRSLRRWRRSRAGARAFVYMQRVTALRDGVAYRMRVHFRWYRSDGSLLNRAVARSAVCYQPAPLPNLRVTSIGSVPGPVAGQRTYLVTVANAGRGEARGVGVALAVDGSTVVRSWVDLLPGRESMVVQMPGPSCAYAVRAVADPDRLIRETNEYDNALNVSCATAAS